MVALKPDRPDHVREEDVPEKDAGWRVSRGPAVYARTTGGRTGTDHPADREESLNPGRTRIDELRRTGQDPCPCPGFSAGNPTDDRPVGGLSFTGTAEHEYDRQTT
jgi:hypothetical protein